MADDRILGKSLAYQRNATVKNIKSLAPDLAYTMFDSTTTSTSGDGTESSPLRYAFNYTVEAFLYDGSSNIITGKTIGVTFGGTTIRCKELTYDLTYNTSSGTTCETDADATEVIPTRYTSTLNLTAALYKETADSLLPTAPEPIAVVLTLATGVTVTGNAIVTQETKNPDAMTGDPVDIVYTLEWQESPVEVGFDSDYAFNTSTPFVITEATGTVTNKETTGNDFVIGRSITGGVETELTVTYTMQATGAISKTVAADV